LPQDSTAPTVVSVLPPDSASDIDLTEVIAVRFSEPVDVRTLNAVTVSLEGGAPPPNLTISPSENGLLVFVLPESDLEAGTLYTLNLSPGITDTAGNPLTPFTSSFSTFEAPVITAVTPDRGPTGASVTLAGQHFDPTIPTLNEVRFDGVAAIVTSATATALETNVPDGLAVGNITLTVKTRGGAASAPFTVENPVPVLSALSPASIPAGSASFTLTLSGNYFLDRSTVQFGGTALSPTFVDSGALQALVPASAVALPGSVAVTVINPAPGGGTSAALSFEIVSSGPTIQSFSPNSGKPGTPVTISGLNFDSLPSNNQVTFNGTPAIISTVTETSITTTVPLGASTGPITVTTSDGSQNSAQDFLVTASEDFSISALPSILSIPRGGRADALISMNSTGADFFAGLASLSVTGLPAGVSPVFTPMQLASGHIASLQIIVAPSAPLGTYPLTITAGALIKGQTELRTAATTVNILAGGQTTLSGQFLTNAGNPIPNIQLSIGSAQTQTDGAGNFLFPSVPSGTQQLMVDANAAQAGFPIYAMDFTLTAGVTTGLPPFRINPPPPSNRFTLFDNASVDQVITDARYPGLSITMPAGVIITGWDGDIKTKIAVERLSPDRLPVPAPPGFTRSAYQLFFGTPRGGMPSAPLPVSGPMI